MYADQPPSSKHAPSALRRYLIGFVLLFLAEIGFGLTFVTGNVLTRQYSVSPHVLSFCRFLAAGSAMLAAIALTAHGRAALAKPSRRDWLQLLWLAPVGTSGMSWCVFLGCASVSVANASMADALTPLMIFLAAAMLYRRISAGEIAGLVCGFAGALLVVQIVTLQGLMLDAYTLGDVFILLAAATWGVYTVCGRSLVQKLGPSVFTAWTMLLGAAAIAPALWLLPSVWPQNTSAWLLTAAMSMASTLMPFWAWNAAQKFLPVSVISVSAYFAPVFAMALAVAILDEQITWLQWLGTALIVASASIETNRQRRQP